MIITLLHTVAAYCDWVSSRGRQHSHPEHVISEKFAAVSLVDHLVGHVELTWSCAFQKAYV